MSLLMDALKKAEEEKKRAAKQFEEVEQSSSSPVVTNQDSSSETEDTDESSKAENKHLETMELSLEPFDSVPTDLEETKADDSVITPEDNQREVPTVDASETFSEDLTLENTIANEVDENSDEAIDLNDTTVIDRLSTEDSSAPFDDTFHGVLFDDGDKSTESYEETLPGIPADQLVKDLGGGKYQPTPVAAQTVFTASRTKPNKSSFKWGLLVALAILAIGSFTVFYYFSITPMTRQLPSPVVAKGIESTIVTPAAINRIKKLEAEPPPPVSMNVDESVVALEQSGTQTQQLTTVEMELAETTVLPEGTQTDTTEEAEVVDEKMVAMTEPAEVDNTVSDRQQVEKPVPPVESVFENYEDERDIINPLEASIQPDLSLIKISKKSAPKKSSVFVTQAFKAYQAGQYEAAKSLYTDVLKSEPDNRDAHLGLAAIAIKNKNYKNAYDHYALLLKLNPEDTLAHNALINLANYPSPVNNESTIKNLLQKEGETPYLFFSLGNIYAKQLRWPEAQEAFFEAYRLDTTNADYVLNLAISLDQIGQYETAYDYYKTAIELAKVSSGDFDFASVNNRIYALSNIIDSKL